MMARVRSTSIGVWILSVVLLVVLLGIPLTTDTFTTYQFANVAIYVIALIGLNLLTGYSGQISLGNGAFMAVGGYTSALLIKRVDVPYLATIPIAGLVAGVSGFLVGIPALRLSGIYLALATFALALALPPVINNYEGFTYGNGGVILKAIKAPLWMQISNEQYQYFLCWVVAGILFLGARLTIRSGVGRAFMAIRDSETAAVASGVSLAYYKTLAFGLSAFYAGVAGALLAILTAFVHPDNFALSLSIALLAGAVVGGLGQELGPLLGGLLVVWLPYFAAKTANLQIGSLTIPGKPDVAYGIFLIVIVFLAPSGVAGLINRGWLAYRRSRARSTAEAEEVAAAAAAIEVRAEPAEVAAVEPREIGP